MWPTRLCWGSLTTCVYQTSHKSIKVQHRGHTLRTSRMRFKDSPSLQSMSFQFGSGFAGRRRPRFRSQLLRTSQSSWMYTIFTIRTIGLHKTKGWKIMQPIIGWHKPWCTSSFWFGSRQSIKTGADCYPARVHNSTDLSVYQAAKV